MGVNSDSLNFIRVPHVVDGSRVNENKTKKWEKCHSTEKKTILFSFPASRSQMPNQIFEHKWREPFHGCAHIAPIDKPFRVNGSRWGDVSMWFSIGAARTSAACRTFIAHYFQIFCVLFMFFVPFSVLVSGPLDEGTRFTHFHSQAHARTPPMDVRGQFSMNFRLNYDIFLWN